MKELLEYLLNKMTDSDDCEVTIEEDDYTNKFVINAPEEFVPLIIGRGGRTINALRSLLSVYDSLHEKSHKKIYLSIGE